jgi:uncharacterized protein YpbB
LGYTPNCAPVLFPLSRFEKPARIAAKPAVQPKIEEHVIELRLKNDSGEAAAFVKCEVVLECGTSFQKMTNEFGVLRIEGLPEGGRFKARLIRS